MSGCSPRGAATTSTAATPSRVRSTVWSRLPALTRVELGPLPDADLRSIVRRVGADLSPRVVDEVARRAEGNAFFAEELAAAARSGGADPGDLTRLLLTRVDQLDDGAQSVVRVAAIIGRRVPHDLLERGRRRRAPPRCGPRCAPPSSTTSSSPAARTGTSSGTRCSPRP